MGQIPWVDYLGRILRHLEEENERIVSGKADRLETLLAIDQALQILRISIDEWIKWIRRPDVLAVFGEADWKRVWSKIYEHVKGILTEDMIHTAEYEERIKRAGTSKWVKEISIAVGAAQQEDIYGSMQTPTTM